MTGVEELALTGLALGLAGLVVGALGLGLHRQRRREEPRGDRPRRLRP